jgi:hypothetical protein
LCLFGRISEDVAIDEICALLDRQQVGVDPVGGRASVRVGGREHC